MNCFQHENHTLYYLTAGDPRNPSLVLLHGFLGSHQDFLPLLPSLTQQFYCILPDLPGHGQTLTAPGHYTFSDVAELLLALLTACKIRRTHLLGYSMGGRLALYVLCEFPERIRRVVLESASPGLKTDRERQQRRLRDGAIARKLEQIQTAAELTTFLTGWYANPLFASLHEYPQLYASMLKRRQNNRPKMLAYALRGLSTGRQPSLWEVLSKVDNPLLLIAGARDDKFVQINREMAKVMAGKENLGLSVVEGCGHNVHLESPAVYVSEVTRFLGRRL
ncbi:MAG: 2-succinyl-6-hydroxy-2,4-cyclohexadiene-1-carboxylate synthase [Cyanobacteria bacterium J06606_4]